jgi:hypothetical protein
MCSLQYDRPSVPDICLLLTYFSLFARGTNHKQAAPSNTIRFRKIKRVSLSKVAEILQARESKTLRLKRSLSSLERWPKQEHNSLCFVRTGESWEEIT